MGYYQRVPQEYKEQLLKYVAENSETSIIEGCRKAVDVAWKMHDLEVSENTIYRWITVEHKEMFRNFRESAELRLSDKRRGIESRIIDWFSENLDNVSCSDKVKLLAECGRANARVAELFEKKRLTKVDVIKAIKDGDPDVLETVADAVLKLPEDLFNRIENAAGQTEGPSGEPEDS